MSDWPKPSPRFAEYVRKVKACGHWEHVGIRGGDRAVIRHAESGEEQAYQMHDGGNDRNSPRNFATDAQKVCGCSFIENRSRKASRKAFRPSGFDLSKTYSNPTQTVVDDLNREWHALDGQFADLAASEPTRDSAKTARRILRKRTEVERKLTDLHQPIPESP